MASILSVLIFAPAITRGRRGWPRRPDGHGAAERGRGHARHSSRRRRLHPAFYSHSRGGPCLTLGGTEGWRQRLERAMRKPSTTTMPAAG
jgi:hypothetical protein